MGVKARERGEEGPALRTSVSAKGHTHTHARTRTRTRTHAHARAHTHAHTHARARVGQRRGEGDGVRGRCARAVRRREAGGWVGEGERQRGRR